MLYIVATPIGHRQDLSLRAIETLKQVDTILAEDTRHSVALLNHYGIHTPLLSLHEHNEQQRLEPLLARLRQGETMALISDAGTPLISDPGFNLVKQAKSEHIRVCPIPGPCALIAALSASGLAPDKFIFEGFLPAKKIAKQKRLAELNAEPRTLIFYESKHRIEDTLAALIEHFGAQRMACLARELTKQYETIEKAPLAQLKQQLSAQPEQCKGEFVLIIEGASEPVIEDTTIINTETQRIASILRQSLSTKQSAEITAKITGERKHAIYQWLLTQPNLGVNS